MNSFQSPSPNYFGVRWRVRLGLLLVVLAYLPALSAAGSSKNPHAVNFSGSWEMDYQASDHSSEKTRQLFVQAQSAARRAAERARTSGQRIDPQIYNIRSIVGLGRLAETIAQASVLTIKHVQDNIVIERNDDFSLVCDFMRMGIRDGVIGQEGCYWDEDQLLFRIALPDGLFVLHRFSIAADRSRINMATTVKVDGIRYPYTLNRVYRPFEPGAGQYECEYSIANQTSCTLKGNSGS